MVMEGNGEVVKLFEMSLLLEKMSSPHLSATPDPTTEGVEQSGVWRVGEEEEE